VGAGRDVNATSLPDPLPDPLVDIDLPLPGRRSGKVRVSYELPGRRRLFVTTDRLSAFDRIIGSVPFKGQVLNELSAWWFVHTADIVDNHAIDVPDPNVLVATEATPLSVEVVVRRYITGVTDTSLWTRYHAGAREIDGHRLPDGLAKNARLPEPIITPTTKGADGTHDVPLSCDEVVDQGLVDRGVWADVCDAALELFRRGAARGREAGLLLADTKYEFGLTSSGRLLLIDEVHTPDSSRWWVADSYDERFARGEEPESLDKEVVRRALADAGFTGDGPLPLLDDAVWEATTHRYVDAFERLTGTGFVPGATPTAPRITAAVAGLEIP
jgi:phosphoribosylaminoimidazole-succinocarboxamide synthase